MNKFIETIKIENNNTLTQNGAATFKSTLDANLDLFSKNLRTLDEEEVVATFITALSEDKVTALRNVLYLLDIREGKGERKVSKLLIEETLKSSMVSGNEKIVLLESISELGRLDYLIDIIVSPVADVVLTENNMETVEKFAMDVVNVKTVVIELIKQEIKKENLLIYKWMPSTRGARKHVAKKLFPFLGFSNEKEYRKSLTEGRSKLKLIETLLTERRYEEIDFEKVPTKAMLKYSTAFSRETKESFEEYLEKVNSGESKINANNLHVNEIIEKFGDYPIGRYVRTPENVDTLNLMWKNQKNFVKEGESAIVVADTSQSMSGTPLTTAIGLAIYFAERNKGEWENTFITFSERAELVELPKSESLVDKLKVIKSIIQDTNIDSVFELMFKTAASSKEAMESMPEHIIIVSDMEFNRAVTGEPNYDYWRNMFEREGMVLPKIIFWNVSKFGTQSMPVVKQTENVAMVSGYSPSVFENLFNLEEFTPLNMMRKTLEKYSNKY